MDHEQTLARLESEIRRYADDYARLLKSKEEAEAASQALHRQLTSYAKDLRAVYAELKHQYEQTKAAHLDTIYRLSLAAEYKDEHTGQHLRRLSRYSALLAERVGLPPKTVELILYASPMHDVGKIGIPDSILLKPGRLTEEEFTLMKQHTVVGADILAGSDSGVIELGRTIALHHHEKWDGSGYPAGLKGKNTPLAARIVSLVDTFDALTSQRPYKSAYPVELACNIMFQQQAQAFDPKLVDAFLKGLDRFLAIRAELGGPVAVSLDEVRFSERDRIAGLDRTSTGGAGTNGWRTAGSAPDAIT